MKHLTICGLAAAAMMAGVGAASAQEAFATNDSNMRAGPGTRFPVVDTIPEGSGVYIHGCLSGFEWCDVTWRRERGWVFSDNLEALYAQRRVPLYEYRSRIDLPVVTFGYGYWDRYYRDRPWFDEWNRWGGDRRWGDNRWDNNNDQWDNGDRNSRRRDRNWSRSNSDEDVTTGTIDDNRDNNWRQGDNNRGQNRMMRNRHRNAGNDCSGQDMGPDCMSNEDNNGRMGRMMRNRDNQGDDNTDQ